MRRVSLLLAATLLAAPAAAEGKKKKKDAAVNVDDLFGPAPAKASGVDAMKKATEGVGARTTGSDLAPKVGAIDSEAGATLLGVFAAEVIAVDKKAGCSPAGREKKKLTTWTFDEVPAKAGQGFDVCLSVSSKAGREMNMSVAIVDTRNQRVAKAEDVIDFRGRERLDHVLSFPAPTFKMSGQHFYVVDLDGKEVGRLPIFTVSVEVPTSGVPGSAVPEPTSAPVTAEDPGAP